MFQPSVDFRRFDPGYDELEDDDGFLQSLHYGPETPRNQVPLPDATPNTTPCNNSLPSLKELRAMSGRSNIDAASPRDAPRGSENGDSTSSSLPLIELLCSIFAVQADINGISAAVVEYLAWIRKSPGRPENLAVLEILEARIQELNHLASTRHWIAFKQFSTSAERSDSCCNRLRHLETDLAENCMKTREFFREKYDISSTLLKQRPE